MTASRLVLSAAEVDLATGVVQRGDGVAATLTPTERALLGFLAGQPGQTVPRDTLLEAVWGYRPGVRSRTLDTAIKVVRRKIERDPAEPDHLATVRGVGYRFDPPRASTGFDPGGLGADAPLYGRDAALAAIDRALADGARVVTVRGPGGIGKTRLARAAIRGRRSRWADLGAAIDDADVVAAVAGAVSPGAPLRDGDDVGRRLAGIGVVCLDGCEAGAAAIAARVARWTAGVFLVTSRVALGVDGERTIELGPLDDGAAVALLVERASTRRPAFGRSDPAVLAAIVAAVDRVPLGIELVAARAGLLDAPALLDRLTRRAARPGPFDWLAADDSRHGSLAATVDWSWGLLPADARIVLAACAVFAGGFRVEAAEAVCGPLVDGPVLPRLELLRDASLLRADHDRLEAWAMVRAFADDHATDRPGCEDRLGDWLAQALPDAPIGRVTAELANLRVALAAAVARRRPVAAALAESLERALASTGPMAARLRAADVAVDTASTPDRRARALVARARARDIVGADGVDADLDAARSLAPDRSTLGRVELAAGAVALLRGRLTDAVDHNRAAIGLLDDPADRSLLGDAWSNLGNAENLLGRRDEAIDHLKRALALQEEVGNAVNAAKTLGILGNVHQAAGNVARGVRFWREALGRHEAAGHRPGVLRMLGNLAVADHALGALDDASAGFGACAGLARELGEPLIEGIAHLNAGAVALEAGDDVRAEALLARARLVLGRTGARMYLARVAVWEAAISLHGRSLDLASRQLAHAEAELAATGDRAWWLRARGLAVAALGADHPLDALIVEAEAVHPLGGRWLRVAAALRDARSPVDGVPAVDALRALHRDAVHNAEFRLLCAVVLRLLTE